MLKWIKKKLGITDCERHAELIHKDLNKAFNRIEWLEKVAGRVERLEKHTRLGKSMRYDEIERARKRRYKNWPKKAVNS